MLDTSLKFDRDALVAALQDAGTTLKGSECRCPFCDDHKPSAGVYKAPDGAWKYKCHKCEFCGDVFDVRAKIAGVEVKQILKPQPEAKPDKPKPIFQNVADIRRRFGDQLQGLWQYTHPVTGAVDLMVVRYIKDGAKSYCQIRPRGDGTHEYGSPNGPLPLYNRGGIKDAQRIIVTEGEKAADALIALSVQATTSLMGAGKAPMADWSPLAGKTVYVWPDFDDPGAKHADDVIVCLSKLTPRPTVYRVDAAALGLPHKGDAYDFVHAADGIDADGLWCVVREQSTLHHWPSTIQALRDVVDDTITGRRVAVPWPWGKLSTLTKALLPGSVCILAGAPGGCKSWALQQAAMMWHQQGVAVRVLALEEGPGFHQLRALAQRSQDSRMLDDEFARFRPEIVRSVLAEHAAFLEGFAGVVETWNKPGVPTLTDCAAWTDAAFKAGARIVAIDPVSLADAGAAPWTEAPKFMSLVKQSATAHSGSVVLLTHPKKGATGSDLDSMAGGAGFARAASCAIWLESFEPRQQDVYTGGGGFRPVESNRRFTISKTRNGTGAGMRVALKWHPDTLELEELGVERTEAPQQRRRQPKQDDIPQPPPPPRNPAITTVPPEAPWKETQTEITEEDSDDDAPF
jgi:hypothetical protein